jgi:hypothetical protein
VGLGDVLVITTRPVTEKLLRWCEATITRENMLVAIVTALYDGPAMGTVGDAWLQGPDDLLDPLDCLTSTSPTHAHK